MWEQVTYGESAASLHNLENYEDTIAEGQRMKLDLNLRMAPSGDIITMLQDKLQSAGMPATVQASGNAIRIIARKAFPWLAIIVTAVLGLIVLAILIVSWIFYKEAAKTLPQPMLIIGAIVGVVLLAVIAFTIYRGGATA